MKKLLSRLKGAFAKIDPSLPEKLSDEGVTDDMIAHLEEKIGHSLPSDFLEFYRLMNGEEGHGYIFDSEELLSFDRILDEWAVWKDLAEGGEFEGNTSDPEAGIKNDWYNTSWIPFTYNGAGDHLCLDFDPAPGGTYGQIIRMWHDDPVRTLEYAGFTEWLTAYIEDLEQGKMVFNDQYLERREDETAEQVKAIKKKNLWSIVQSWLGFHQK